MKNRTASISATLAAATLCSTISADFVTRRYSSGSSYELEMSHMTDLDQRRTGLGADGGIPGKNYCVPTATSNLFTYIAQHGYSYCDPGDHDWQSDSNHTRATDFIARMAGEMGTSASGGTSHGAAFRGARRVLRDEVGSRFVIEHESRSAFNEVTLKEMTRQSVDDRAIQQFCYGKYEVLGTNGCDETVIWRRGGHCMTLVGAYRSGSTREITYHDPDGTGDGWSEQSSFTATTKDCPWRTDLVIWPTVATSCLGNNTAMNRIMRNTGDGFLRLIDSRIAIYPAQGYSWSSFSGGTSLDSVWSGFETPVFQHRSTVLPDFLADARITISPSGVAFVVVPGPDGGCFSETRGENGSSFAKLDLKRLGIGAVDEAVFAGDRTLVVRVGRMLFAIAGLDAGVQQDDEDAAPTVAWSAEVPFTVAKLVPSYRGQSGVSEYGPHSVLAFSPDMRLAMEVSGDPEVDARMIQVPAEVPLDPALSDLASTSVVEDSMGTLWFAQPGSKQISALLPGGQVLVQPLPVAEISGFAIDDLDNLLVVDSGMVRCFSITPNGILETGAEGSHFAGQQVGKGFTVTRSSSNYEARFHGGPEWNTVPDPETAPCIGDLDGNGRIDGGDLAALLGAWGSANGGGADLDGDGLVTGADLSILLGGWGACP
jgi:hypothetical protein